MKFNIFKKLKKGGEEPKAAPKERVMELSSRGLSEPEIISSLRKEGYSPSDVDSAMKEALKSEAGRPGMRPRFPEERGIPPEELLPGEEPLPGERLLPGEAAERPLARPAGPPEPEEKMPGHREMERPLRPEEIEGVPRLPQIPGEEKLAPPEAPAGLPEEEGEEELTRSRPFTPSALEPPGEEIPRLQPRYSSREQRIAEIRDRKRRQIMELTEELVEEKWVEVEDRIKDIEIRFKELEAKISGVEERMGKMKWEKGEEVKTIKENIDSYRDSMGEMNSKMESLEKAVKSSLSPMMESMRSLSDTIKILKKGKKEKGEKE